MTIRKRTNENFSFTERFHEFIRHPDWRRGYVALLNGEALDENGRMDFDSSCNMAALFSFLSGGFEEISSDLFESIGGLVENVRDVETCNIRQLQSIAKELGVLRFPDFDMEFPPDIEKLINFFSVSISKTTLSSFFGDSSFFELSSATFEESEAPSGIVISGACFGSELSSEWTLSELDALSSTSYRVNDTSYLEFVEGSFRTAIQNNIESDGVVWDLFDIYERSSSYDSAMYPESDSEEIEEKKTALGVSRHFFAKQAADDVIEGRKRLKDFSDSEQEIISAEVSSRSTMEKFGDRPTEFRRFQYEKMRNVRRYISLVENLYSISTETVEASGKSEDELGGNVLTFFDSLPSGAPLSSVMIETSVIMLRNKSVRLSYLREYLRQLSISYSFIGTERSIRNAISDYLFREFSSNDSLRLKDIPGNYRSVLSNASSYSTETSSSFGSVKVIEYVDSTEYMNLSSGGDSSALNLSPRFWEGGELSASISSSQHTQDDILSLLYNVLGDNWTTSADAAVLLEDMWAAGALSATLENSGIFEAAATWTSGWTEGSLSSMLLSYMGSPSGSFVARNVKNTVHPSIALQPFLWNLRTKADRVGPFENVFTVETKTDEEMAEKLDQIIDENGSPKDLWRKDNPTFSAYRTSYQFSRNRDEDGTLNEGIDYDGPFYSLALSAFIDDSDKFITDFDRWYGHIPLKDNEREKIILQLQSFRDQIFSLSGQTIFQYGVDRYNNHYTLFKDASLSGSLLDEGTGTVWVRVDDHPLSFPAMSGDSTIFQIDNGSIDFDRDYEDSKVKRSFNECVNFGFLSLSDNDVLWALYDSGNADPLFNPAVSGDLVFLDIEPDTSSESHYRISLKKLAPSNFYHRRLTEGHRFVGVYSNRDEIVTVTVSGEIVGSETDTCSALIAFSPYSMKYGRKPSRTTTVEVTYPEYFSGDGHNSWKMTKGSDRVTVGFESRIPTTGWLGPVSSLFQGTSGMGTFDPYWNDNKNLYENGLTMISFQVAESCSYPVGIIDIGHYGGYTNASYMGIHAWEGKEHPWTGRIESPSSEFEANSLGFRNLQFFGLGESHPVSGDLSTSAFFSVEGVEMMCFNSASGEFGLWINSVYPSWEQTRPYDWTGDGVSALMAVGPLEWRKDSYSWTWDVRFPRLFSFSEAGNSFIVRAFDGNGDREFKVEYDGEGCHLFSVTFLDV